MQAGWDALDRCDWAEARRCFAAAVEASEDPAALEGLGWAAWWSNDPETLFIARERAYRAYRKLEDPVSAARVAIWLASDHHDFRGEPAVANGWYRRARRLLEDQPVVAEHAWLEFHEGAYALELEDDTATARSHAEQVSAIARELSRDDLELLGLDLEGLGLVVEGRVDEGMRRLDEVGVAATSGEVEDRIVVAWALCHLIYACEQVRDFERTAQWCARLEEASERFVFDLGIGVCRTYYGGVLVLHGEWQQAERELAGATEVYARTRPLAAVESEVRTAELRRRQGRVDEARQGFQEAMPHPLAVVGLAHLALDEGDVDVALELLGDLLDATPTVSVTQRADALELLAHARARSGDAEGAREAATALGAIAASIGTTPLRAMAAAAAAAAAEADADDHGARRLLEEAVERFENSGLPYETAIARLRLARVLQRLERAERADEQARRALERLRALGALYAAQRAEDVLRGKAADPVAGHPAAALGLTPRETEVISLLAEGLSDRAIAERLCISVHTVHRHVSNILTKLDAPTRAAAAAVAGRLGLVASRAD